MRSAGDLAELRPRVAGAQVLLDDQLLVGRGAARPGRPPAPNGSRDQRAICAGAKPSDAAQTSVPPRTTWMQTVSLPSAAPSADRIRARLDDGSADTRRSARPCSRVSWPRAEESISCPDSSAATSSGCVPDGSRSATTRPWRRTTIRSASRNIWSMSRLASRIVVPWARRLVISSSTCPASSTPSEAVGSSSTSSRGSLADRLGDCDQLALPAATASRSAASCPASGSPGSRSSDAAAA